MYSKLIIQITYNRSGPNSIIRHYSWYVRRQQVIQLTVNYTWRNDFFLTHPRFKLLHRPSRILS